MQKWEYGYEFAGQAHFFCRGKSMHCTSPRLAHACFQQGHPATTNRQDIKFKAVYSKTPLPSLEAQLCDEVPTIKWLRNQAWEFSKFLLGCCSQTWSTTGTTTLSVPAVLLASLDNPYKYPTLWGTRYLKAATAITLILAATDNHTDVYHTRSTCFQSCM